MNAKKEQARIDAKRRKESSASGKSAGKISNVQKSAVERKATTETVEEEGNFLRDLIFGEEV